MSSELNKLKQVLEEGFQDVCRQHDIDAASDGILHVLVLKLLVELSQSKNNPEAWIKDMISQASVIYRQVTNNPASDETAENIKLSTLDLMGRANEGDRNE